MTNEHNPYHLGALAYETGALCPFQEGSCECVAWHNGFDDKGIEDEKKDAAYKAYRAYRLGYTAYEEGWSFYDNPFEFDSVKYHAWRSGYNFADYIRERSAYADLYGNDDEE